ncbi:hypothetical protein BJ508DRAFT_162792 [Ascobolus immersus RN42]|uniref:Uncharacterized protein n=1 Tax=Ascobolus immersus RN42 TaxID=1160509 RepID=A0A3N4HXQ1_ASCIM|nr:hypothetical protein BJ508DRAFT_162792 [Ascobolus immersus RN42]
MYISFIYSCSVFYYVIFSSIFTCTGVSLFFLRLGRDVYIIAVPCGSSAAGAVVLFHRGGFRFSLKVNAWSSGFTHRFGHHPTPLLIYQVVLTSYYLQFWITPICATVVPCCCLPTATKRFRRC